jgi:hypothetical protein
MYKYKRRILIFFAKDHSDPQDVEPDPDLGTGSD